MPTGTYDPTTAAGQVRLLISDVDTAIDAALFSDAEIDTFLTLESNVFYAASRALSTVAGNEVMRLKHIRSHGLELDGPAVGRELRMQAAALRDRGDQFEADGDAGFLIAINPDVVGFPHSVDSWRW